MEAVRYLKSKGYSQKDIVTKSGIAQNAISKIKNGENNAGDETIRKVAQAFRLNIPFFYGNSPHISLLDAIDNESDETQELYRIQSEDYRDVAAEDIAPKPFIPSWAESFFDIMTQQIKQNEALNRELRQSIAKVTSLTKQLTELVKNLNK